MYRKERLIISCVLRSILLQDFYTCVQDTSSLFWVAYNHAPEESDLTSLSQELRSAEFAPLRRHTMYTDLQAEAMFEEFTPPFELWKYFLLLSILLLCTEIGLLRYL